MKIRFAESKDFAAVYALSVKMHAESRFRTYPLSVSKVQASIESIMVDPKIGCILLAESAPGKVVGMLAGYVVEYFFSDTLVAQDRVFFVQPEHRGSSAALKLLIAFRRWAENRGAVELCININVDIETNRVEKFMKHMSFKSCGSNFVLQLQKPTT